MKAQTSKTDLVQTLLLTERTSMTATIAVAEDGIEREEFFMHCHVQIYYKKAETLVGFDPLDPKDRQMCHEMLDEYLTVMGRFMAELKAEGKTEGKELDYPDAGFHIWPEVNSH